MAPSMTQGFLMVLSLLANVSQAAQCTSSNAITVESLAASGALNFGGPSNFDVTKAGHGLINAGVSRRLIVRAGESVECTTQEGCYSLAAVPFCANLITGYFHSADLYGNLYTGAYTIKDGQTGNLYFGPQPTLSVTASPSRTSASTKTGVTSTSVGGAQDAGSATVTVTVSAATLTQTADATARIANGIGGERSSSTKGSTTPSTGTSSSGPASISVASNSGVKIVGSIAGEVVIGLVGLILL